MTEKKTLYCSFCGKSQHEARKLIAGPVNVFICDECAVQCVEIAETDGGKVNFEEATRRFVKAARAALPCIESLHVRLDLAAAIAFARPFGPEAIEKAWQSRRSSE